MEVKKNQAELNWQKSSMDWTPSRRMEVNNNQMKVNWDYPMVHKYKAEANKCLNASASEW